MTLVGLGVGTITRQTRNPEMYSWNLSIQRDMGWSSMVEIAYTGSRGVHLYSPYTSLSPLDPVYWLGPNAQYTRAQLQAAVPNPFYGIITDPKAVNLNGKTIQQYRLLRNMPQYDGVSGSDPNAADSNYHGVQLKYEKRFSRGLTVLTHYTWSRMIDDASVIVVAMPGPPFLRRYFPLEKSDERHTLSTYPASRMAMIVRTYSCSRGSSGLPE